MDSTFPLTKQDISKQEPVTLVSPQHPTKMETIFLSNIDQALVFTVETVYFFQVLPDEASSTVDICRRVKTVVEDVLLVPYYFMAGRLSFNEESRRLELLCNNAGVVFVSASSRLVLKELGNPSLPNLTFHHLLHRPGLYKSFAETALLTIQVTRFACGGFSIGFVTNHAMLDGKSAIEMFENLASVCRGEGLKTKLLHNDRTCFKARNPPVVSYPHKEYVKLGEIPSMPTSFTAPDHLSPSPLVFSSKCVHKLFSLTPEMISALKEKFAMDKCSTFEATVAHVWRARTKSVFSDMDEFSTVLFAVDVRSKVSPPLPSGFTGNAVVTAFATARVGDLWEKPFAFCVEKMKEATARVTDEYVRSVIDWLEVHKGIPASCKGNFYVSAWLKLPFNELDFGYGKPTHGGPVVSGNDEFVLLLSDGKTGGGINVWMGLEQEKMNKFMVHIYEIDE